MQLPDEGYDATVGLNIGSTAGINRVDLAAALDRDDYAAVSQDAGRTGHAANA
jgi:hypothetical protein